MTDNDKNATDSSLSKIDINILRALQKDGRKTYADLSRQVGLTSTPCMERVKRLERDNIIEGYQAKVNPEALGMGLVVFVHVGLHRSAQDAFGQFNEAINEIPEIQECFLVSGSFDYLLKVRTKDMSEYRKFYGEVLLSLPGVEECSTYVAMEQVKETTAIPL